MRPITMLQAQFKADTQTGESLRFEACKGGYFSNKEEYGLKVVGKTVQTQLSGRNLLNPIKYFNSSKTDYVRLNGDIFSINLEAAQVYINNLSYNPISTAAGTYTVTFFPIKDYDFECSVYLYDLNGNNLGETLYFGNSLNKYSATFTASEDFYFTIGGRYRFTGITTAFKVELKAGSGASTEYEPYCGGYPSPNLDYPQPIQCVKAGTKIVCGSNYVTTPCDLYEGDIFYPASGKVERHTEVFYLTDELINKMAFHANMGSPRNTYRFILYGLYSKPVKSPKSNCLNTAGSYTAYAINLLSNNTTTTLSLPYSVFNDNGSLENAEALAIAKEYLKNVNATTPIILYGEYLNNYFTIEQYEPQPIAAPQGTVIVTQEPTKLSANLEATMLVRR